MKSQYKNIILILISVILSACVLSAGRVAGDKLSKLRDENDLRREIGEVLPDLGEFYVFEKNDGMSQSVKDVYVSDNGVAVRVSVIGYAPGLELLCGIRDGRVTKIKCISSRETLGAEKTYGTAFEGKDHKNVNSVPTVSGATKTTGAYKQGIIDALDVYGKVTGK